MPLYEYRIEAFNARGGDDYVDRFSALLDRLFESGWTVLDSVREQPLTGWWRVELQRERGLGS